MRINDRFATFLLNKTSQEHGWPQNLQMQNDATRRSSRAFCCKFSWHARRAAVRLGRNHFGHVTVLSLSTSLFVGDHYRCNRHLFVLMQQAHCFHRNEMHLRRSCSRDLLISSTDEGLIDTWQNRATKSHVYVYPLPERNAKLSEKWKTRRNNPRLNIPQLRNRLLQESSEKVNPRTFYTTPNKT